MTGSDQQHGPADDPVSVGLHDDVPVTAGLASDRDVEVVGALGALEPDDLDGHSVDELTDYLDAGMTPADPSIDDSPACQLVLAAIVRLRHTSLDALEDAARDEQPVDEGWLAGVMSNITLEARAGRDIPYATTSPLEVASVTEGAVRALVRSAGDGVPGVVVVRCELDGDVTLPGEPVRALVTVTVRLGRRLTTVADEVRTAVAAVLAQQTELDVVGVDVVVRDVITTDEEARR